MSDNYEWQPPFEKRRLTVHSDVRGSLFEILRFQDQNIPGKGQLYSFTIAPGQRRGDHYHHDKEEWFICLSGQVILLLTDPEGQDYNYHLDSGEPEVVYIGRKTIHALLNRGDKEAVILSYASTQHEEGIADTFYKKAFDQYQE